MKKSKKKFKKGQVVLFDKSTLLTFDKLSDEEVQKYYGSLLDIDKNGDYKPRLFVFITTIDDEDGDTGHCLLIDMQDKHIEMMRHTDNFRAANEDEF